MKRDLPMLYWLLLLFLLAALLLVWLLPLPWASWRYWRAPQAQAPQLADIRQLALLDNPDSLRPAAVIAERPLFSSTRRPFVPGKDLAGQIDVPEPEISPLDDAILLGVIDGPALSGVMLKIPDEDDSRFVRVGSRVGDWQLKSLQNREALFEREDEQRRIQFPVQASEHDDGGQADVSKQHSGAVAVMVTPARAKPEQKADQPDQADESTNIPRPNRQNRNARQ